MLTPSRFRMPTILGANTACQICSRWQAQRVCLSCLTEFAPRLCRCRRCGLGLTSERADQVCSACEDYPPELDQVIAAVDFAPPWSDVIGSLKFGDAPALAHTLSKLLSDAVHEQSWSIPDLIVPIPLSSQRWKERGYNQAWLLAQQVARRLDWSNRLSYDTLIRQRETGRLMAMQSDERQRSISNAFGIAPDHMHKIVGQHIALVDDVMTTGATANEAARTLLSAGAASVTGWFAARTPAPKRRERSLNPQAQSTHPASDTPRPATWAPKRHQ